MSTAVHKKTTLIGSAGIVAAATAFSRVLGLIREQVMAYYFGASMMTDAFVTAFRIPNLLRDMFAEGALSAAFVPVFKERLVNGGTEQAFSLANRIFTAVLLVVSIVVLLGIVATPAIVYITAYGFTDAPAKFDLTVSLTRLMFVYLLLVSLSSVVMGMLNSLGRFGLPALSPALFNIGIIGSVIGLHAYLDMPVYALAIGVLIGGVGQLVVQLPLLLRLGYRFRPDLSLLDEQVKKVVRLFVPMIVGMSAGRINILIGTLLASLLVEGSISWLSYGFRLMHFPLGVFAVALGTVALPRAAEVAASGDMEELKRTYEEAINLNFFIIVPAAAFLALWGREIVELVFQYGAFSSIDAENTARVLLHYSYGLIGLAAVRVTVPFYYSLGDSRLPTRISVFAVLMNMALYFPLIKILSFAGIAAATSMAALANFIMLTAMLPSKGLKVDFSRMALYLVRIAIASILAAQISKLWPFSVAGTLPVVVGRILDFGIAFAVGGLAYIFLCFVLRVRELTILRQRLFRRGR